jgi:ketosteroid isomerase-like protein
MPSRSRPRTKRITWTIALLAAAVLAAATDARGADDQAVAAASAQFYSALNALFTGDVAPMQAIWSHRDDVTYMGPAGGFAVGWDAVGAMWEKQAALKLGGRVRPVETHITVGDTLAVVSTVEQGENSNVSGKTQRVSIRATNLFRNEHGTWKMIGHHTDLLPQLEASLQVGSARSSGSPR